jgi:hypothetical protein
MNDVLREVGGTLGVAVLGSILAGKYASEMEAGAVSANEVSLDSVDGAHVVAAEMGGDAAASLVNAADQAFVTAMAATTDIAAAVALAGALVALVFLPSRSTAPEPVVVEEEKELAEPVAA